MHARRVFVCLCSLVVVTLVAAGTAADWSRDTTFVNCSSIRARVLWV